MSLVGGGNMQDLRFAIRALRATPAVTGVAVLSLALGIGANTAIFSIVDSLLLRRLPVMQPQRLATVSGVGPFARAGAPPSAYCCTYAIWEQIKQRSELFDGTLAYSATQFNLATRSETEFVEGLYASGSFFDVLGVRAILGRTFGQNDDRRGGGAAGAVAVISYSLWQRRFGGAVDVIGRVLSVERTPFTIVGVVGPEFFGPEVGRLIDIFVADVTHRWTDPRGGSL
jgi:putative ABC transport system permease protein